MPDWFYTANYLTPEEARDYYHNKIKQQSQEQADQKNQEKEIEKQIDEQLEKKVIPAI